MLCLFQYGVYTGQSMPDQVSRFRRLYQRANGAKLPKTRQLKEELREQIGASKLNYIANLNRRAIKL